MLVDMEPRHSRKCSGKQMPGHYEADRIVPWGAREDPEPAEALTSHMKKVIRLRQRRREVVPRYASKNNGNIARLSICDVAGRKR